MAIYINGIKVAGNSFSPYQIAVANGYTGTESEFNTALTVIGETAIKYEELSEIIDNALIDIETAKNEAINSFPNTDSFVLKNGSTMTGKLILYDNPIEDLQAATKQYVDEATASIVTDIFYYGPSAPNNTKLLWIDSNETNGVLQYYNPTTQSWTAVPVAWG